MTCEETQKALSPYLDGRLSYEASGELDAHLRVCPVCRLSLSGVRGVVRGLAHLERPAPPPGLAASIRSAVAIERAAQRAQAPAPLRVRVARWLEPHLMPYTVGVLASLLLFVSVLSGLRPDLMALRDMADAARASSAGPATYTEEGGYDVTRSLSPEVYAAARTAYATQSPSLDPRGALAALAWSPPSGRPDDDDMVVVADVYANGRASLAAVMEPPRNPRMLDELEDALRKNPAFVPASLDRRPETMRVVFVLQKMNVREGSF